MQERNTLYNKRSSLGRGFTTTMENLPKPIILETLIFFFFLSLVAAGRDVELTQRKHKLPAGLHQIGGDTKIVVPTGPDPIHHRSEGQIRIGFQPERIVPGGPNSDHNSLGLLQSHYPSQSLRLSPSGPDSSHHESEGQIPTGFQPQRIVPGGPNSDHNSLRG